MRRTDKAKLDIIHVGHFVIDEEVRNASRPDPVDRPEQLPPP